jgi:hypothetical protein
MDFKIKHSNIGNIRPKIQKIVENFMKGKFTTALTKQVDILGENWDNTDRLLEYRKILRDEVKAAFEDRDDRVARFAEKGEVTNAGHEPTIALYAVIIDYLLDKRMQELRHD